MEVDDTEKFAATTATGRKIRTDYVPKGIPFSLSFSNATLTLNTNSWKTPWRR